MIQAIIFNNGEAFTGIALEGEDAYAVNILRKQKFLVPILIPNDIEASQVLYALNSGKKRILKTATDILVDAEGGLTKISHYKLSKR